MATLNYTNPDQEYLDSASNGMLAIATSFAIDSPEMYTAADEQLKLIKQAIKDCEAQRTELVAPLNVAVKRINDIFRSTKERMEAAAKKLSGLMLEYQAAERLKAENERRRLEELQREKQERQRLEAERLTNEAMGKVGEERMQTLEQARELEMNAEQQAPIVVEMAIPKATSSHVRTNWTFEITDISLIPREYLVVDEKKIRSIVKAMQSATKIPGVRAYEEKTIAVRT